MTTAETNLPRPTNDHRATIVAELDDWCVVEVFDAQFPAFSSRYVMPVTEAEDVLLALDNRENITTRAEALALMEHLAGLGIDRALEVLRQRRDDHYRRRADANSRPFSRR
jgi:hypothetical protein